MKARVKTTGEIVDVEFTERKTHTDEVVYITQEGCLIEESRLDFNVETIDYWTRLEHTYVGMFMKSFLDNFDGTTSMEILANDAIELAHALVEKLKEKEERK